ncbi:MAG: ABC transporter ATP-binding protein [Alphaproteobacteria bacterium]|nr:ABC transporter ATP-binding protein [Alphaproteobacteria bacterium]
MPPPSSDHPLSVSVHAAGLTYAGVPLFAGLDFTLPGGQWTCLLGPSGVGKTSLLKLIAGLLEPWAESRVMGGDGRPLTARAGYMAQQDLLMPWLTVLDNVLIGVRLRGEDARAAAPRARELLAQVGLADRAGDRPASLSGGQRQRVALARTLMEDRPVVLMDEPFSALDAITRHRLQALAARLLRGRTVLLVTHDPLEALRLGHRVHVMAGRPATLDQPLEPAGAPPRDVRAPDLLALQAELIQRLAGAEEMAA